MSLRRFVGKLFSNGSEHRPQEDEQRYDNVRIVSAVDGTNIQGHDAVKAHFAQEKELYEAYGSSIIFQVYRLNLQANTLEELQGPKLAEIKVDGEFVSRTDTVAAVKLKVRSLLERQVQLRHEEGPSNGVAIEESDHITFYFSGHPMQENAAFYADNFIMLPAWVQVLLHHCEFEEVAHLIDQLRNNRQ
jgi:hypothetical protein